MGEHTPHEGDRPDLALRVEALESILQEKGLDPDL